MLGVLAAVALTLGLVGAPAGAASLTAQPTAVTEGGRVVITIKGKKPTKATLIVGGTRYQLKRKGKVWRTKPLSAEALAGMSGAKAKVKVRVKGKNKTLKTSIQGTGTNPTTPEVARSRHSPHPGWIERVSKPGKPSRAISSIPPSRTALQDGLVASARNGTDTSPTSVRRIAG